VSDPPFPTRIRGVPVAGLLLSAAQNQLSEVYATKSSSLIAAAICWFMPRIVFIVRCRDLLVYATKLSSFIAAMIHWFMPGIVFS
jgi:uncharacterized membrane protein YjjP (DUF1212 family)